MVQQLPATGPENGRLLHTQRESGPTGKSRGGVVVGVPVEGIPVQSLRYRELSTAASTLQGCSYEMPYFVRPSESAPPLTPVHRDAFHHNPSRMEADGVRGPPGCNYTPDQVGFNSRNNHTGKSNLLSGYWSRSLSGKEGMVPVVPKAAIAPSISIHHHHKQKDLQKS